MVEMGWLFGNRTRGKAGKDPRAPEPRAGPGEEAREGVREGLREEVHTSPALRALVHRLRRSAPPAILDLGPAVGVNVEFFSAFSSRLTIADLHGSLAADERLAVRFSEQPEPALSELLSPGEPSPGDSGDSSPRPGRRYDVVLVWDLFNYLTREQMEALGQHLGRLTRPGAHLLTLVATAPQIPAEPIVYKIDDEDHLRYTIRSSRPRKSPRWAPADLGRSLAGFTVDRSYLLRHGVQEYLMLRKEQR